MRLLFLLTLFPSLALGQVLVQEQASASPTYQSVRYSPAPELGECNAQLAGTVKLLQVGPGRYSDFLCDGVAWRFHVEGYVVAYSTGQTAAGAGPVSGVKIGLLTPTGIRGSILGLGFLVRIAGACGGGCTPGASATLRLYQGTTTLCTLQVPCTAAAGTEVAFSACPSNTYLPVSEAGPVRLEYATPQACTTNPVGVVEAQYDIFL